MEKIEFSFDNENIFTKNQIDLANQYNESTDNPIVVPTTLNGILVEQWIAWNALPTKNRIIADQKSKEIFGESFTKEFPKEGTSSFEYDEEIDKYFATEIITDNKEDLFLLSNINKTSEGYIVDIIEYLEDYSEENNIKVVNFNNEEIGNISISENESKVQEIVKNNKERFSKKRVVLKKENDKLVVQKVEKV